MTESILTAPHRPPSMGSSDLTLSNHHHHQLARIDDDPLSSSVDHLSSDEYHYDSFDEVEEEDEFEFELSSGINEVMDQDWADASGDFTKRYNRLKQHVIASTSTSSSSTSNSSSVLPAINRPKRPISSSTLTSTLPMNGSSTSNFLNNKSAIHANKVTDQLMNLQHRYASKISLDPILSSSGRLPSAIGGAGAGVSRKGGSEKVLNKDKSDRATNEQVLDPRTRLILFKMLGRGLIERVDGCVSTGKEANVYHAIAGQGEIEGRNSNKLEKDEEKLEEEENQIEKEQNKEIKTREPVKHYALKIYKTSILIFKDRDRYVSGEFRFKSGYARSNPRKMVRLWAEKEMRNLRRMRTAGLRVPEPIEVRENVLVMEFMGNQEGDDEWEASPRLKDASIPSSALRPLYLEILVILRTIFQRCKLVHADFSEYNILYHRSHLVIIDVSQSVEQDHPAAFDFLRSDLKNAEDFFAKRGVETLGLTRTFGYVTRKWEANEEETDEDMLKEAERLLKNSVIEDERVRQVQGEGEEDRSVDGVKTNSTSRPSQVDEAVFAQAYIPRALDQVYDIERDVAKVLRGEGDGLIYADLTGVAQIRKGERDEAKLELQRQEDEKLGRVHETQEESDLDSGSGSDEDDESDDEEGEEGERRPRGKKFEDKDEKKKRRAEVKAANREKRSQKMKKSEKARKVKKSSGKK